MKENTTELVNPLDIKKKIESLDEKNNTLLKELDTQIKAVSYTHLSEVVSLVAQNKAVSDIIHGLNMSVASKVGALAARLGQDNPGEYMTVSYTHLDVYKRQSAERGERML